jgi:hypothetical protein
MIFAVQPLDVLGDLGTEAAADLVSTYYRTYDGRLFDRLAVESPPDRFTASDLYAVGTLSAAIDPTAGAAVLEDIELNDLLAEVPVGCSISDSEAANALADGSAASVLYARLRSIEGLGPTRVSKLLAAKRPALVPIRDSYVEAILGAGRLNVWWTPMVDAWADGRLAERVGLIRSAANSSAAAVPEYVTDLRLLDVVLWMTYAARGK